MINRAVNLAIQPESDLIQWGVPDRWSAPLITLATGRGDCEDYAIAKYVALQEAGVSERDLRVVIVHDLATAEDHAVVAARFEQKWLVLDNRRLVLLEDIEMPQVVPLFVLERDGVRQFATAATIAARDRPRRAESRGTVVARFLSFHAVRPLRIGQRLQPQRRGVGKSQHHGFAPCRQQPMLGCLAHYRCAKRIGHDQPGVGGKYLAGNVDDGCKEQPVAVQPVFHPLLIGAEIGDRRLDLNNDDFAVAAKRHQIGATARR